MGSMKTPGVYIVEKNAFPNSVVAVPTAVPAFIGHTETAMNGTKSIQGVAFRITSMLEYETYFGKGPELKYDIINKSEIEAKIQQKEKELIDKNTEIETLKSDPGYTEEALSKLQDEAKLLESDLNTLKEQLNKIPEVNITIDNVDYHVEAPAPLYTLYYHIVLFFANGGGSCYIVSVGDYNTKYDNEKFTNGINALEKEMEPTMIIIPEAVNLSKDNCQTIQQAAVNHCGKMKNRIAILDIFEGYKKQNDPSGNVVKNFREMGISYPDFVTAYYPWIRTSVVDENDISSTNIKNTKTWLELLECDVSGWEQNMLVTNLINKLTLWDEYDEIDKGEGTDDKKKTDKEAKLLDLAKKDVKTKEQALKDRADKSNLDPTDDEYKTAGKKCLDYQSDDKADRTIERRKTELSVCNILLANSPAGKEIIKYICSQINLLPPSAAMAGIYSRIDNSRGVWKAPANVGITMANQPAVNITDEIQEDLNVDINGKSINAIRYFKGEGVKVWGARTLDGNSQDWRYINVRRTMIFLEQSIKNAARAYVFEPNVAGTWINMKSMIENFLLSVWKQGGLAGASPEDAYSVHVGLGDTMTAEDILEGILRITVLVAISRPAEFIEITFQQQMQKS